MSQKPGKQLIKPDGRKWYEYESQADGGESKDDVKPLLANEVKSIANTAEKLLSYDIQLYVESSVKGDARSDFRWMNKVMKTGTLPDRMAAFTVRIQDSPVHNLHCLQQLIAQVKVQGKQQCLMTAETVKDLFLEDLLPPDRKLRSFDQHHAQLRTDTKKNLILWLYEDRLKNHYSSFIQALGRMANDTVDKLRGKAISIIQQLLTRHPEQESTLLQMLVNKLGDPIQKVGSRALFHLNKLIVDHPRMKMVVVEEVERLLFRNNVGKRAQYYGICFLNIIRLGDEHPQLSVKLIKVYLAFFKGCIKQGEIDSKLMSALLTGVNKAFPKAKMLGFEITESVDTLYKIVRLSQFNIRIQALSLLLQMIDIKEDARRADRYYRVLYDQLLHPDVAITAHAMKFLNVVHKSMKVDVVLARVIAFSKRLLQICHHVSPNTACGILFLLSDVSKTHRGMLKLGAQSETTLSSSTSRVRPRRKADRDGEDDSEDESSKEDDVVVETERKKLEKFLRKTNVKIDGEEEIDDKSSSSKVSQSHEMQGKLNVNGNAAGSRLNSRNTSKTKEAISSSKNSKVQKNQNYDIQDEEQEVVHVKDELEGDVKKNDVRATCYDAVGLNPAYCGADLTLAFELTPLAQHFHPSVALFAQTLLNHQTIKYEGNPLRDFTVTRFLERFVYRNPKVNKLRPQYEPKGLRKLPVNSSTYLQTDESLVPVEERFFYKYFKNKKGKTTEADKDESDLESVDDEEFEQVMGNYFKANGALASDDEEDEEEEEDDDETVDFAANIKTRSSKKAKGKNSKKVVAEAEENDDEEEDEDVSDMEDFEGAYGESDLDDEEAIDADDFIELGDDGIDEEGLQDLDISQAFDDDDDLGMLDGDVTSGLSSKKNKKAVLSKKIKKGRSGDNMFLPAEQFADMMDENADLDLGGSHTLINRDNSNVKQLQWETDRDRWVKGYKRTSKSKFKSQKSKRGKY